MAKEYVIYCDESVSKGKFFSNFYGGVLVPSPHLEHVIEVVGNKKADLNLSGEVKWQKVTANYLDKYKSLMDLYFQLMREGKLKTRIMFTQNRHEAQGLEEYHIEHKYFLLYYEFIKHAFGLAHSHAGISTVPPPKVNVRLYFDKLPDKIEKTQLFKDRLLGLNSHPSFRTANVYVPKMQIAEINSHEHDILQCLDVVLGSIQFRLNNMHLEKPPGAHRRGKRTLAKLALYKHIYQHIADIYPRFNIGMSTGIREIEERWIHKYRHWKFVPKNSIIVPGRSKRK